MDWVQALDEINVIKPRLSRGLITFLLIDS
jgi:hypothetical protein